MSRAKKSLILFVASIVPHLYGITSPVLDYHYHRQANTAVIARNYHEDGLPFLHPRIDWHGNDHGVAATEFPLYMWLVGLFWGALGLGQIWGRILSVLFSGLTTVVLFHFLSEWLEEDASFWGALMFCFLPVEVYFGRTVQPESLALLCYAAALWAFGRYLRSDPFPNLWGAFATVSAGITIALKIPYAHVWLILAFLAWTQKGPAAFRDWKVWFFLLLYTVPAALWYLYTSITVIEEAVLPTSIGGILNLLDYLYNPRVMAYYSFYHLFSRFPELTTTYAGLVFFGFGAWTFYARKIWFPFLWWLAVLGYTIAGGGYTFVHEYTALPFALVNAAFLGIGFVQLQKQAPKIVMAILILAIPVHMSLRIKHWYNLNYTFLLRIKPITDKLSAPNDLFFCNNRASSLYLFFIERRGWSWDLKEYGENRLSAFDAITRQGAKFFLTEKDATFSSKTDPIARHFFKNFRIAYEDPDVLIFRLHPIPRLRR